MNIIISNINVICTFSSHRVCPWKRPLLGEASNANWMANVGRPVLAVQTIKSIIEEGVVFISFNHHSVPLVMMVILPVALAPVLDVIVKTGELIQWTVRFGNVLLTTHRCHVTGTIIQTWDTYEGSRTCSAQVKHCIEMVGYHLFACKLTGSPNMYTYQP